MPFLFWMVLPLAIWDAFTPPKLSVRHARQDAHGPNGVTLTTARISTGRSRNGPSPSQSAPGSRCCDIVRAHAGLLVPLDLDRIVAGDRAFADRQALLARARGRRNDGLLPLCVLPAAGALCIGFIVPDVAVLLCASAIAGAAAKRSCKDDRVSCCASVFAHGVNDAPMRTFRGNAVPNSRDRVTL